MLRLRPAWEARAPTLYLALAAALALALLLSMSVVQRSAAPGLAAGEGPLGLPLPELSLGGLPGSASPAAERERIAERYGKLPLAFEENRGQTDHRVDYLARAAGQTLFLSPTAATLSLSGADEKPGAAIRLALAGANANAAASALERRAGTVNYLKGERSQWQQGIPTFGRVRYESVYPGVDLAWYGTNGGRLEYDFLLEPGADPSKIALRVEGAQRLSLARDGALRIRTAAGTLTQRPPLAYQTIAGKRVEVKSRYRLEGERVSLVLGRYDRSRALVIDPVLAYSTYLGGDGFDGGNGIALDSAGSAYVTGVTASSDFPSEGAYQGTYQGNGDAFVTKLAPDGSELAYSTYLGGEGFDGGNGIALDSAGSAYVTGETESEDFPTTTGAFEENSPGDEDAFVTKVEPDGSDLAYSTYLGGDDSPAEEGEGADRAFAIAVDAEGSAYVTGETGSTDFPTTTGAFEENNPGDEDAFVTKVEPDGSGLAYSTYLGGDDDPEEGTGIAVDSGGSAYVTGVTGSSNFPTTTGAFEEADQTDEDAFVSKLAPDGTALAYSTYLGGNGYDIGYGIAVDSAGSAYLTGSTTSSDFPTTAGAFEEADQPGSDAFVSKLAPDGSELAYSTYLGGDASDGGFGIAVDSAGSAYVTGVTASSDFPTTAGAFEEADQPDRDAFISKLAPDGSEFAYSTYLGGDEEDEGRGIAVDAAGSAYLTGETRSSDFPTTAGAFQAEDPDTPEDELDLGRDAFVSQLAARADLSLTKSDAPDPVSPGAELTYTLTARNDGPDSSLGVRLIDQLPAGVEFVSAQASQGSCEPPSGAQLECALGNLAAGASATVTIRVRPESEGTITNRAELSADTTDPDEADNDAEAQTTVQAAQQPGPDDEPGDDDLGDDEDAGEEDTDAGGDRAGAAETGGGDEFGAADDSGGEVPLTGLALGALALVGLALFAGGRLLRRGQR